MKKELQQNSWRKYKIAQWLKPPDITFNAKRRKLRHMVDEVLFKDGKILDIGSGGRNLGMGVINFDIDKFDQVAVVGDAHQLPFGAQQFDLIIITAVLEHVTNPEKVIHEVMACLKIGGRVYVEVPFLQGYHADPHDYQRYTLSGLKILFQQFKEEESGVCDGPVSVLTWYLRKFPTIFFKNIYLIKCIEFITGWLFFSLKYLDYFIVRAVNSHILASGIFYIGRR
jgi:SAM-dependent methyltransferase